MPRVSTVVAAVILGLIVSTCGGQASAAEIRSAVARAGADPAAVRDARAVLDAFSVDLYKVLARGDQNLILSPYSVGVALAMTRAGAVGETATQMDKVLHAALSKDINVGFNALDQSIAKRPGKYTRGDQTLELELATANRLWGQKDFKFEAAFLDQLARSYGGGSRSSTTRTLTRPRAAPSTTGSRPVPTTASRTSSRRASSTRRHGSS